MGDCEDVELDVADELAIGELAIEELGVEELDDELDRELEAPELLLDWTGLELETEPDALTPVLELMVELELELELEVIDADEFVVPAVVVTDKLDALVLEGPVPGGNDGVPPN